MYQDTRFDFGRVLIARALAYKAMREGRMDALEPATLQSLVRKRWGADSEVARLTKAAVSTSWADSLSESMAASEFFDQVAAMEVLSRLPAIRKLKSRTNHYVATGGAVASFVGEGKAIPATAMTLSPADLVTRKVGAIVPATRDQLEDDKTNFEVNLQRDIGRATAEATDFALLDDTNDGSGEEPQSITYGAPSSAATGDAGADFAELIESFAGDLMTSALVMHPLTAAQLALTGNTAFEGLGVKGGEALGLPCLTSRSVPHDSSGAMIALVDGAGIAVSEDPPEISFDDEALIELSTVPTDTINVGVSKIISLFQEDAVAFRFIRRIVWKKMRANAVSVLTGAFYLPAS